MTATVLLVFGRGVVATDGRYALTPACAARVGAVVGYVAANESAFLRADRPPRIVFTGGWAEASAGADEPPAGCREGDLMLELARTNGLDRYAELHAETRSRSTLENLVRVAQQGLIADRVFDGRYPLGLVSHSWHLPRVRYLAGKVLGLDGAALLDVQAGGGPDRGRAERMTRWLTRMCLAGADDPDDLLRRERTMVASIRRARRLAGWV